MASVKNTRTKTNLDAIVDDCDLGTGTASAHLYLYSGTAPTDVDTSLSGNTLLADLTMSNPAFGSAVDTNPGASVTAAAITSDSDADATGTATFFRIVDRDGTPRIQGSVGTSGAELNMGTTSIVAHGIVSVSSLVLTCPDKI